MKKFEIKAFSYNEAKEKALEMGIAVVRNVTPSYKRDMPVDFDAWAGEILKKNHLDSATGVGLMVVRENGSADTRERPYELLNNIVEGSLTKKRVFQVRTKSGNVIGETDNKEDAIRLAKKNMKDVREDMTCVQLYKVLAPKDKAFDLKYVPAIGTKEGSYIVFGN